MKTRLRRLFSGLLIAAFVASGAVNQAVFAIPPQTSREHTLDAKHEPKRGINPETGKVSFIGAGEPINVPGTSRASGLASQDRAMGMARIYGKEFGLNNPSQELKLLKASKEKNGNDIVRYQQIYHGVPVLAGEMIVNLNPDGDLLSISGEVSSDLELDLKPAIKAQEARKIAVAEIAKIHDISGAQLTSSDPELWIFDESLLTASTRLVELVWRMEVNAKGAMQPIREMVLVNAQTGEVSFHINQVDTHNITEHFVPDANESPAIEGNRFSIENAVGPGWYVALSGSDSNGCASPVFPCLTIQSALSKVQDNGTIFVAKGTYSGTTNPMLSITNKNNIRPLAKVS